MNSPKNKLWLALKTTFWLGLVFLLAWWSWESSRKNNSSSSPLSGTAVSTKNTPSSHSTPIAVGVSDSFAALSCRVRQYDDRLALAVTFTQPLNRNVNLQDFFQVMDLGAAASKSSDKPKHEFELKKLDQASPLKPDAGENNKLIKGAWVVGENPRIVYFPYIHPQHRYRVSLAAELVAAGLNSSTLGESLYCDIETPAMLPSFYFANRGVVLPAGQNGGLPVATVNVPEVDVQFLRVAPEHWPELYTSILGAKTKDEKADSQNSSESRHYTWPYKNDRNIKGLVSSWNLDHLHQIATSVYQGRFLTDEKRDRHHTTFLPVENIKELQEPGIYIAIMNQPGRFQYEYQVTYFYVSDIGLHVRRYPKRIDAFTVSLKTGEKIEGIGVELIDSAGKVLSTSRSDANGHVVFEGEFNKAKLIRAVRAREMTVVALGEPALDLSEFDSAGYASRNNKLFVYAGRNLYRPREKFNVSILARNSDGNLLEPSPLTATLKQPDGRVVRTELWPVQSDSPGYFQHEIELSPDAQAGQWLLELRVDPGARIPDAYWKFQVEEFLPERMKLELKAKQAVLDPKEQVTLNVQGDYLYGAPANGNRLLSTAQLSRERFALPMQWPGFIFGDIKDDQSHQLRELPEVALDPQGQAKIEFNSEVGEVHSPMKLRFSASLLESGGRPVIRSVDMSIWPAKSMLAVRPLFHKDVTSQGSAAEFEIVRVNTQGEIAPLEKASLRLYREEREYYWRFDDERGWNNGFTENDELIESRSIVLMQKTSVSLPVDWGRYRLEVNDPQTGQTLRYRFYAGWDAQDAEAIGMRPDRVQIKLEGVPAQLGKRIKVKLTPPHDGQTLVTVEGDQLLWSTWVAARTTGTELEIPLDPAWTRHDLYVAAVTIRAGGNRNEVTPTRAVGLAYLPLDSSARKLEVQLEAAAEVKPETQTLVHIKVAGAEGKQALVTLSAVDEGILNINQYPTPDPFDFFFGKHRYAAELLDMYGKIIEKMTGTLGRLKWGGDAPTRASTRTLPKKVKLVDWFSGPVKLDTQGQAEIKLNLPDFNGSLRLMAVAFTADKFGSTQAKMRVAAPIVAELNTPRFITPGDEAVIALDVTNLSSVRQTLTVKLQGSELLTINHAERTLNLEPQQRNTLRFNVKPTGSYGLAVININVEGQNDKEPIHIKREAVLSVQPAQAPQHRHYMLRLVPNQALAIPSTWTSNYRPDSTTINMSLSGRPPLNVKKLLEGLFHYPYGCTEQTISATLPVILIDQQTAKQFDIALLPQEQRKRKAAQALARILGARNNVGAFSLWGGAGSSTDVWLTAYALNFMLAMRQHGFEVSETTISPTRQWLLTQLQQHAASFGVWSAQVRRALEENDVDSSSAEVLRSDHQRFAGLAHSALVLASEGKAPLSTVRQLFDKYQERSRSMLPLMQLAAAFKLMGDEAYMKQALQSAFTRRYSFFQVSSSGQRYPEWLADYGSEVRDLAWSYVLMNQYELQDERREGLVGQFASLLEHRTDYSTQERIVLLLAAQAMGINQQPNAWNVNLTHPKFRKSWQGPDDQIVSLTTTDLNGAQLTNTSEKPLYVAFDIQGDSLTAPEPQQPVIKLERQWYKADGQLWKGGALKTGDILIVRIQARADRDMPDGLIVDPIPAGFEVENLNLSQGPEMHEWTIGGERVAAALANPNIKHSEFRDDRYVAAVSLNEDQVNLFYRVRVVTPGHYIVPSTVAEDMYRPELGGVSQATPPIEIGDGRLPDAQ